MYANFAAALWTIPDQLCTCDDGCLTLPEYCMTCNKHDLQLIATCGSQGSPQAHNLTELADGGGSQSVSVVAGVSVRLRRTHAGNTYLAVALECQDVCCCPVQKPSVVADHQHTPSKVLNGLLQTPAGNNHIAVWRTAIDTSVS
eukprot:GHRR01024235.1.p1 GENE.GHRR01024235.1~~GHRR01024235.1.p1  ORF type:complete len:144 (-),score=25.15 GHRR01024235.1:65-496(-)